MITEFEAACAGMTGIVVQEVVTALQSMPSGQVYQRDYDMYCIWSPGIVAVQQDIFTNRFTLSSQREETTPEGCRSNLRKAKLIARELGFGS